MSIAITSGAAQMQTAGFNYIVDQFADVQVLRYRVPGFEDLSLQQKEYIYYLAQAAEAGRDILFDQNYRYNLYLRRVLENIYLNYKGDRNSEIYLKRVWFSNGIHHHYSMDKFAPGFSEEFFKKAILQIVDGKNEDEIDIEKFEKHEKHCLPILFDATVDAKRVNQSEGEDLILTSANNYYQEQILCEIVDFSKGIKIHTDCKKGEDLTQKEVEDFYNSQRNPNDLTPISYGLNSRLIKNEKGELEEQIWKIGGKYDKEIRQIVYWLNKAKTVAENDKQKEIIRLLIEIIRLLIEFYTTGNLKTFDEYSIAWVKDTASHIDFLNGFIETYGDPLGIKASWEANKLGSKCEFQKY